MNMDHDHSHMMDAGDGEKHCPMSMIFHNGHCETILFKAWTATTVTEFVLSAIAIFFMGVAYEGLKLFREYLLARDLEKSNEAAGIAAKTNHSGIQTIETPVCDKDTKVMLKDLSYKDRMITRSHLIQTVLNFLQVTVGYLLMLIAMTFNVWLFLAVVLGFGAGYFIFGCMRTNKIDHDCCS